MLGLHVGLLPEGGAPPAGKRAAYLCDVTYGTGYEFGFDYLRDQLTLQRSSGRTLGAALLESLAGVAAPTLIQRELYYAIVDEADNVLLDDAAAPLILSDTSHGEAEDAEVHRAARRILQHLRPDEHLRGSAASSRIELTEAGTAWIHRAAEIPIEQLRRTWTEYVEQALRATTLRRDVHYIVADDGTVKIVDHGTGRIFTDRTWRSGLHQAVEAKEGLRITPERQPLAQITRQRFSRLYRRLAGTTGTASGCEREFRGVYRLDVAPIPLRTASRRSIWPMRCFVSQSLKWNAIADSVERVHGTQRPVLVGTASIDESEHLAELFRGRGLDFQLLNGRQDAAEATIIAAAGRRQALTIATSLAGRGTDIRLGPGVAELGGLHVVVSQCGDSARIDRQLMGRCARQGDPGSAQLFVSSEDKLLAQHGAWLAQFIQRHAGSDGELKADLGRQLRRIQQTAERAAYAARRVLLRRDLSRDSLYGPQPLES
jgi:preprotein translocase subunit SecA